MRLAINGGLLVDPAAGTETRADLYVAEGCIVAAGEAPPGFRADRVLDAAGLVVCPGLVDLWARLGGPGAGLDGELAAAVAGGVTRLACPPDSDPPLDEPGLVEMLARHADITALARVHPVGALTRGLAGEKLAELGALSQAGCVAFSQGDRPVADLVVLWRALQYATTFGFRVWLHPEDGSLARGGVAHDGEVAGRLGLPGIPALAETVAVATALLLARDTGTRLHLTRLSCADSVEMVRRARAEGMEVTCDVSAHHLHLSELDLGFFDPLCRLEPPLRSRRDRDALARGVADGTIQAVCSDHRPLDEDDKQLPFGEAGAGATGLELLLPLTLKWALDEKLALPSALAPVTTGPARVLGLEPPSLAPGAAADLCLFDPGAWWTVERATLRSRGANTPFSGYELPGRVRCTLVAGRVVHESR